MLKHFIAVFSSLPAPTRRRVVILYAGLALLNIVAWVLTFIASAQYSFFLATAVTAYTFGLRHAVDADHIAAIDNVTRKLMQDGKRPVAVGFFFSMGHSTIVVALSGALAIAAKSVANHIQSNDFSSRFGLIGTSVSALFLLLIGAINLLVLLDIYRAWRKVTNGGAYEEATIDDYLNRRGLLARMLRPAIKHVDTSWKMYPLGVLFGLGFDTASEVGLLGIVTTTGSNHLPIAYILVFPLLFLAGMSLIDTSDGIAMLGAYGWAFLKPIRKLYYNMTITLISVLVAIIIGLIEGLQVVSSELHLRGSFWDFINNHINLGTLGYIIVGVLIGSWIISTFIYRWRDYDAIEVIEQRSVA